ncbi:hypothetical protein [Clostridium celatum]|uniref:hypothetical protein n=1 Tax=Clostridium celatum TaxID=36834 RepID=UPI00189BD86F|nr:hypothetical protein [Clostridium celatum]MCE9655525.1 hypothetical protein [Clostridium celatum]MDU3723826.1 hypothetical protein [Clostridium celatum]
MSKSEKISQVLNESNTDLNLHEIKAKTGAGNGFKHHTSTSKSSLINNTNKSKKIYDIVTNIEGKINLHKIKSQTGAGNGFKDLSSNNIKENISDSRAYAHKSHKIHAIFHASDRKLNLHEIKAKTGAGNGYKQH